MSEALGQSDLREGYKEVPFGPKTLVVPSDWSTEQFGDVFQRRRESIDDLEDGPVRYVGLKNLDSGRLNINGYDEDGCERSSSRAFHEGDILFGKLRPNLNKAAIAPFSGVCSSDIIPLYTEEDARQQYLPYLMHSKLVRDRVISTMEGTNLPRTSWSDLKKTLIPLPPLLEQRRIADILSTVDEQIQQTNEIIEETKKLKRGLVQDLVFFGESHNGTQTVQLGAMTTEIAESWDVSTVGDVTTKTQYGSSESLSTEGTYPVFRMNNIEDGKMVPSPMKYSELDEKQAEKYRVEKGDILFNRTNSIDLVGKSGIFDLDGEYVFASYLIRLRTNDQMNPYFLNYYLNSHIGQGILFSIATRGASQANINATNLKGVKVPLPPRKQQDKIVEQIQKVEEKIEQERETKQRLQELKRGLMQDLLTGKVRVNTDN
jgi:type I restriction enzyme S subunit